MKIDTYSTQIAANAPQYRCYHRFVGMLTVAVLLFLAAGARAQDITRSDLCNNGSTTLYFATVADNDSLLTPGAMTQGFVAVPPDTCADIVPYGMRKVTLAFFMKDSRGLITNPHIAPENVDSETDEVRHVCVNPKQSYRVFAGRQQIASQFVNGACPPGFSVAQPAWIHRPGGLNTYNITVHADRPGMPWKDADGQTYTDLPALRQSSMSSDGALVQTNPYAERSHEQAKIIFGAFEDWWQKSQREAEARRAASARRAQQQRARYEAEVDRAESALEAPPPEVCAAFSPRERYKRADELALSGVQLKMPVMEAHQAMVCNGFSINPQVLARAGGVEKFWARGREKTYEKRLDDGRVVFTDVEVRPVDGTVRGSPNVVMSVRIRHQFPRLLSDAEWQGVRETFKETYKVGKKRAENAVAIHRTFKLDGGQHLLQLNGHMYRVGEISAYDITML